MTQLLQTKINPDSLKDTVFRKKKFELYLQNESFLVSLNGHLVNMACFLR